MSVRAVLIMMIVLAWGVTAPPAGAQVSDVGITSPDNNLKSKNTPYLYKSDIGRFQVMMPGGCAKIHQRLNGDDQNPVDEDSPEAVRVLVVSCDRFDRKGEGCSVTTIFHLTDGVGGDPGPDQVLQQVRKVIEQFGVRIEKQSPVAKEFPDGRKVEGIDVRAVQPGSSGQLWVRGLLSGPDIYLLTAWNMQGGLWETREYQDFFNSFAPSLE